MRIDPKSVYSNIKEVKSNKNNSKVEKHNSDNFTQKANNEVFDSKIQRHVDSLKNIEVFREDLVSKIKGSITDGSYQIDTNLIASKMLSK